MIAAPTSFSWMLNAYFLQFGGTPLWVILLIILLIVVLLWWGLTRNNVQEPEEHADEHASEQPPTALAVEVDDTANLGQVDSLEAEVVDEGLSLEMVGEEVDEAAVAGEAIAEDIDIEEPAVSIDQPALLVTDIVEEDIVDDIVIEEPSVPVEPDDLKIIEGIGPKISSILIDAGITTFQQLADTDVAVLNKIVREDAGIRIAHPGSWPKQASFAAAGDWDGLEKLQDELVAGR